MRAFRFSAQAALRVRQRQEQAAELALSQSLGRLHAVEQALAEWKRKRDQTEQQLSALQGRGVQAEELGHYSRHAQYLMQRADEYHAAVELARQEVQERQEEWIEARRRRSVVERLRARQYQRYLAECRRETDRELDEVATSKWWKRGRRAL